MAVLEQLRDQPSAVEPRTLGQASWSSLTVQWLQETAQQRHTMSTLLFGLIRRSTQHGEALELAQIEWLLTAAEIDHPPLLMLLDRLVQRGRVWEASGGWVSRSREGRAVARRTAESRASRADEPNRRRHPEAPSVGHAGRW